MSESKPPEEPVLKCPHCNEFIIIDWKGTSGHILHKNQFILLFMIDFYDLFNSFFNLFNSFSDFNLSHNNLTLDIIKNNESDIKDDKYDKIDHIVQTHIKNIKLFLSDISNYFNPL